MSILVQQPMNHWSDTKAIHVQANLTFSGSYTTGGDTLNFATINRPVSIKTGAKVPMFCEINNSTKYEMKFVNNPVNPTLANGLVKIFSFATGLEIPAGPYPADLLADMNISFYAIFKKYVDLG